jgi:hypothetical protein
LGLEQKLYCQGIGSHTQGIQKSVCIWPLTYISRSNRSQFVDFRLKMSVIQ